MKTLNLRHGLLTFPALLLTPCLAFAHPGMEHASDFSHGFSHPFSGLDHILAMLAVGIWAAQISGKALWTIPSTFVGIMILGGILGANGIALPFVEEGIGMSVLILGGLIAAAVRWPLFLSSGMVALFAFCHGQAHGTEIPNAVSGFLYGSGFVLTTILLHLAGIGLAFSMKHTAQPPFLRYAGGMIALAGIYLLIP